MPFLVCWGGKLGDASWRTELNSERLLNTELWPRSLVLYSPVVFWKCLLVPLDISWACVDLPSSLHSFLLLPALFCSSSMNLIPFFMQKNKPINFPPVNSSGVSCEQEVKERRQEPRTHWWIIVFGGCGETRMRGICNKFKKAGNEGQQ